MLLLKKWNYGIFNLRYIDCRQTRQVDVVSRYERSGDIAQTLTSAKSSRGHYMIESNKNENAIHFIHFERVKNCASGFGIATQCAHRLFYERRKQEQMSKVIWRREASRRTSTLHVPVHSFGLNSKRNHLQRTGGDHRGGRAQPG